jgi:hypothetical protein
MTDMTPILTMLGVTIPWPLDLFLVSFLVIVIINYAVKFILKLLGWYNAGA